MKRIKDLTATATNPSSDDYLLLDGNTNGTRKILADLPVSTATQSALNNKANLSGATFTGGITATNLSGTNTGDQDLSGLVPKTTTVNGHPLSSNVTVTATDTGAPTISSGNGAPSSTPEKIGDIYVDTVLKQTYIAKGNTSSADWVKQNGSYSLAISATAINFNDSSTYYLGGLPAIPPGLNISGQRRIVIAKKGIITGIAGQFLVAGTLGSNETTSVYIRVNDTTDYLVSNSVTMSSTISSVFNTSLNIPVILSDFIELKVVTPNWTTNPVNVHSSFNLNVDL